MSSLRLEKARLQWEISFQIWIDCLSGCVRRQLVEGIQRHEQPLRECKKRMTPQSVPNNRLYTFTDLTLSGI